MNEGQTPDSRPEVTATTHGRPHADLEEAPTTGEVLWAEAVAAAVTPVVVLMLAAKNWPAFRSRHRAEFARAWVSPRSTTLLAYLKSRASWTWRR